MTGDQKVEMVESAVNWNQFFVCLRFIFIIFIYTGNFQVSPEKKSLHPKTQSPPKIPICPKFLLYKPSGQSIFLIVIKL